MSVRAIYRRWRPRRFDQIVGQDHITRALRNAVRTDRVAHGYLFCGPRGVAKTTTARVLAKAINCLNPENGEPCDRCDLCVAIGEGNSYDVIEMDAASNGLVENVRELRQHVLTHPDQARRKVYILDEAHRMSASAFDALLKTLEEPPDHVVFVLVTSEAEKIPATIVSRCQRFDFRRLPTAGIVGRLVEICAAEQIAVEPASLETIARAATGSLRDAQSILDQILAYGETTLRLADVEAILGTAGFATTAALARHALRREHGDGLIVIRDAVTLGVDPRVLGRDVARYLRSILFAKIGGPDFLTDVPPDAVDAARELVGQSNVDHLIFALRQFGSVDSTSRGSLHNQLPLELAFIESALWEPRGSDAGAGTSDQAPPSTSGATITRPGPIARRPEAARPAIPPRLAPARGAPPAPAPTPIVERPSPAPASATVAAAINPIPAFAPGPFAESIDARTEESGPAVEDRGSISAAPTSRRAPETARGESVSAPTVGAGDLLPTDQRDAPEPIDAAEARHRWDTVRQAVATAHPRNGNFLYQTRLESIDGSTLRVAAQTSAHQDHVKRLTKVIIDEWRTLYGQSVGISCSVASSWERPPDERMDPAAYPEIRRALQRGWRVKQTDAMKQPIQSAAGPARSDDRATEHEDDSTDATAPDEGAGGTR